MKHEKRIVLFTLFAMNLIDQPAPYVTIEQGTLSGKINADGTIFEYLGIPYATSNKETRFKAPLPPPKWDGVYKAVDEMYSCPQTFFFDTVVGSEDCLKINVYVPAKAKKPLPVLVYIHGGAFIMGSGGKLLYGPEFLVKNDVILVTFHYRLGALGFVCLGTQDAPGNAGLKDQIAALRWVKKNIIAFGGDPENVTLFGESAGGVSISILLASEVTQGLFNKVIMQSGSSLTNWAINRRPTWVASLLVRALGHNTEDPHEIYKILNNLPYQDLIRLKPKKPLRMFFDTLLLNLPCVEKPGIPGNEPVLSDLPYNLLVNKPKNISVIHGSTSREGLLLMPNENDTTFEERNQRYLFASDLDFKSEDEAIAMSKKIKEFYFGNKRISRNTSRELEKYYTELYFEFPTAYETEILLSSWNVPVYNYLFNYSGGRNVVKNRSGFKNEMGACHADDIFYLFDARLWPFPIMKKDNEIIDGVSRMWTNFAKYGNPTPSWDSKVNVKWTPSTKGDLKYLYIDDVFRIDHMPNEDSFGLWKEIYDKYRRTNLSLYFQ